MIETRHAVFLAGREVGVLHQRGDHVRFVFLPEYWEDPERNVLGLWFEDHRDKSVASALRLPSWFANLLPEGRLRQYIASDRNVSPERDMELLAQVGLDLPGAVQVLDGKGTDLPWDTTTAADQAAGFALAGGPVKFSLAGVGLKFSMRRDGERFTLPGTGFNRAQWILKLPDPRHPSVPQNEFAMMSLAREVGIDVPEIHLVHRADAFGLPDHVWPEGEEFAYAIKRFDRDVDGNRIHIEDFAQVRGFHVDQKYVGTFETVGALCYRGSDVDSLHEFVRRLTFNIVIGNGDAHLKNWSLIYPDGRIPRLSPAYDIVSTVPYNAHEDLGLKFGGTKRFERISLHAFARLERNLEVTEGSLVDVATETYKRIEDSWNPMDIPDGAAFVRPQVEESIKRMSHVFA